MESTTVERVWTHVTALTGLFVALVLLLSTVYDPSYRLVDTLSFDHHQAWTKVINLLANRLLCTKNTTQKSCFVLEQSQQRSPILRYQIDLVLISDTPASISHHDRQLFSIITSQVLRDLQILDTSGISIDMVLRRELTIPVDLAGWSAKLKKNDNSSYSYFNVSVSNIYTTLHSMLSATAQNTLPLPSYNHRRKDFQEGNDEQEGSRQGNVCLLDQGCSIFLFTFYFTTDTSTTISSSKSLGVTIENKSILIMNTRDMIMPATPTTTVGESMIESINESSGTVESATETANLQKAIAQQIRNKFHLPLDVTSPRSNQIKKEDALRIQLVTLLSLYPAIVAQLDMIKTLAGFSSPDHLNNNNKDDNHEKENNHPKDDYTYNENTDNSSPPVAVKMSLKAAVAYETSVALLTECTGTSYPLI